MSAGTERDYDSNTMEMVPGNGERTTTVRRRAHHVHMPTENDGPSQPWTVAADAVIAHLPQLHERFETHLGDLVAAPAVSARGGDLTPAAGLLAEVMRGCGLEVSVETTPGAPIVLGSYFVDAELPTLLVYGHYDVQPAEPLEEWHTDPFRLVLRDGRFLGRGTADNKAQHLAQLMAIRAMLDVQGSLPVNVQVVVEGGEEIGSPHLGEWLSGNAERLGAELAYTSDGALHPSGRPVIVCGVRGLAYLEVTLTVSDCDRHSGNFSGVARNAAEELVHALGTLWDASGRVLVAGFSDAVTPYTAGLQAIARLPLEPQMLDARGLRPGTSTAEQWFNKVLLEPSLNLCGIDAGWTGPSMKTIIPGSARAKLDARLVPDQSPERVAEQVRKHLQLVCPDIEVELIASMEPSRTSLELPFVDTLVDAVTHAWGAAPFVYPNLAGSLPDAAFTKGLGIPSLIVPYGNSDQQNHAPNENMAMSNFHAGARTLVCVLHALRHTASAAE